jgi:GlpG protein
MSDVPMIQLISVNNPRMAQAFIDYMAAKHVDIKMMADGDGQFSLWLNDDRHLALVQYELSAFLKNPNDRKYQAASWEVGDGRQVSFRYASPNLLLYVREHGGKVTLGMMVLCLVIYGLSVLGLQNAVFGYLHFPSNSEQQWQIWRWFTHALLHFGVLHIVFNLLWWWLLGGVIEKRLGSGVLASLFFITAAGSGLTQYEVEGAYFGGLSGVVYGLVGFLWMIGWQKPQAGIGMPMPILIFMLLWLVIGFVQPFYAIANSAHLSGLLIGMGLGLYEARCV